MAIKALFFDIDGTLVSFKTHRIPESTVDILRKVKQQGIKIFIATGRPTQFIINLKQIEDLIDGWVTTNGANCFIGEKTIYRKEMKKEDIQQLIAYSDEQNFPIVIVGNKDIAVHHFNQLVDDTFHKGLGVDTVNFKEKDFEDLEGQDILQMTPFCNSEQENYIMQKLKNSTSGRWCDAFIDITARGAEKGEGIAAIAKSEGFKIEETMAFGDYLNDMSLLESCGESYCMKNGHPTLKALAKYVTEKTNDENGVMEVLKTL